MKLKYYLVPFFTLLVIPSLFCDFSYAGSSFQSLSTRVNIIDQAAIERANAKEKKRADDAIRNAKHDAAQAKIAKERNSSSALVAEYMNRLRTLRDAISEQNAYAREVIYMLSLNKKYGSPLTEFDVVSISNYANGGRFSDVVKYLDGVIEINASSSVGATIFSTSITIK